MAYQLTPTTPAAAYRPTYGVTYGGTTQPVTRSGTAYGPGGTLGGFGIPGQKPTPPALAAAPGAQVPTMGAPLALAGIAPGAGGALSGTNGLAGAPMTGGVAPAGGGILGAPDTRKLDAYREYDPVNFGTVGGLLASAAGMASPIAGLLNVGRHIYNTEETAAYDDKIGYDTSLWDRILGYFGLNSYGAGSISANGKSYEMGPPNPANPKGSDRGVYGGVTAQARGATPAGYSSMRDVAQTSVSRGPTSVGAGMRDPNALVGTGGTY
jgi:hypothetical protein